MNNIDKTEVTIENNKERMEPAVKKGPDKKKVLMVLCVIAALIIVALVFMLLNSSQKMVLEGNWYQTYAGATSPFPEGGELLLSLKTGKMSYKENGEKRSVANLPLYSEKGRRMLLADDFVYYDPRSFSVKRLDRFSIIDITNDKMTASYKDESCTLRGGYLYNGEDLYIFLEPVNVTLNGYTYKLPAFSYVEAVYGNGMVSYNYETGESIVDQPKLEITASPDDKTYTVSLIADSMVYDNNDKVLLFVSPERLESVYEKSEH